MWTIFQSRFNHAEHILWIVATLKSCSDWTITVATADEYIISC